MSAAGGRPPRPGPDNDWAVAQVDLLCTSHARLTGRDLAGGSGVARAAAVYAAPYALLSHGIESDPLFNYGNATALSLFEFAWEDFVRLPSRASAEPALQSARARLMERVLAEGWIDDYSGVRIAASGRRFLIENVTVWNVLDDGGHLHGQAALIHRWRDLPPA